LNGKVSEEVRTQYADEIAAISGIRSQALRNAFARVPRQRFLGPAPWRVLSQGTGGPGQIQLSEVSDPRDIYRNVAVMLDESRTLTNGNPGTLAPWIDALGLCEGASVFHVGCGSGYYSAVIAEVVEPKGSVTAVEIDPKLASMARENLSVYSNVDVIEGDGGTLCPGPRDAILVNAGVTHPAAIWLDNLKIGGTLLVPLTFEFGVSNVGKGFVLRIKRERPSAYTARFLPAPVMIYSCTSVRDASAMQLLAKALMTGAMTSVQSLRRDPHAVGPTCWLHTDAFCLSTTAIPES
jgi:protein-L-isoaspartate(D-aspartate) O-methyltransferase